MNPEFWRGKRVFLTGHTGFKGGWLALWLNRLGASVSGYALAPPTKPSLFDVTSLGISMAHSQIADVRDAAALSAAVAAADPEVVFHLAAQSLVRASYQDPLGTYAVNVMGTAHLLEAARLAPSVRAVVVITSDKCYENREWPWAYRENDALGGHDPYSSSKGCAELVTAAYRRSFLAERSIGVASARAGNVIGGGDWAQDRLLPDLIRALEAGKPLELRNPGAVRPWQHVLEPLAGYLLLAERLWQDAGRFAGAWNFGPRVDDELAVADLVGRALALWEHRVDWKLVTDAQPHEARLLRLDCSLAHSQLGWTPQFDLQRSLEWSFDWFRAYHAAKNMLAFSMEQLDRYQGMLARAKPTAGSSAIPQ